MTSKLGILAGGGTLPTLIASSCSSQNRPCFVVVIEGQGDPEAFSDTPHAVIRLGAAGKMIKAFRKEGVEELVWAGSVRRPNLKDLRPDFWGAKFLARTGAFNAGDDGLFRALLKAIEEEEGFRVVGVHQVLPGLLTDQGIMDGGGSLEGLEHDIDVATAAALDLGREDVGQAAVAAGGRVIALETREGTRAMLEGLDPGVAAGGVLAKMCKPGQDERVDLPTIGPDTVAQVARAGLKCIVLEAGKSVVLDKPAVAAAAAAHGITVVGVGAPGTSPLAPQS